MTNAKEVTAMKMIHKPIILAGLCVALFAAPALASSDLADPGAFIPGTAAGVQPGTHHVKLNTVRPRNLQQQHRAEVRQQAHAKKLADIRSGQLRSQRLAAAQSKAQKSARLSRLQQTAMLPYPGAGPYDAANGPVGP